MRIAYALAALVMTCFAGSACSATIFTHDDDNDDCPSLQPDIACVDPCTGTASSLICVDGGWTCPPISGECGDCPLDDGEGLDCIDDCGGFYSPTCIDGSWECEDRGASCAGARWALGFPGGYPGGDAIARDAMGNVIVAGHFTDDVQLGALFLTCHGGSDLFVLKLAPDGTVLWAQGYGDDSDESVFGLATRPSGAIVVGWTSISRMGTGGSLELMELDPAGGQAWSRSYDVYPDASSRGLALDGAGNIVVAGTFWSATANLGGTDLDLAGASDVFVAKLDPDGDHLWSRALGDASAQSARALAVSGDRLLLTGDFHGTIALESGDIADDGDGSAYLIALYEGGAAAWAAPLDGAGAVHAGSVAADNEGGAVITGMFDQDWSYAGSTVLAGSEPGEYVAGVDSSGILDFVTSFSGASNELVDLGGWSVAVDANGDAVIAGQFFPSTNAASPGVSLGAYDLLLLKVDGNGVPRWGYTFGSTADDWFGDVAIGPDGDIAVTGTHFGSLDLGSVALSSGNASQAFTALFGPDAH